MFKKTKEFTAGGELNDTVIKNLAARPDIVYYNYETKAWNTNTYNGYSIKGQKINTEEARSFKGAMEREPKFNVQYEMAAIVTMTIDRKFYPGWKHTISTPRYSNKGTAVVGNIIVKNKTTGKYELYCESWVGVYDCLDPDAAVNRGAYWFAFNGAWNFDFRAKLIAAHAQNMAR